jgi:cytochrome c biogenesis protein CcmG/thiol:disulfide interchange protein DsbE
MNNPKGTILVLILTLFAAACNSADAPRPVSESEMASAAGATPRPVPTPNAEEIVKAHNVEIEKLDGKTFKLADFRGKVLVVDFWATYCPPCVKQMPKLAALSKQYKDQGVEIVGLSADDKADREQVTKFLKDKNVDYTIGFDNRWLSSAFLKGTEDETGAPPIPQLFVISRDGRVVEHLIGDSPNRGIDYVESVIKEQLNNPTK